MLFDPPEETPEERLLAAVREIIKQEVSDQLTETFEIAAELELEEAAA